jgi:hypothetical protein
MNKTAKVQEINTSKGTGGEVGINWSYVLKGTLTGLAVLVMVAFWGIFAYSMITENVKLAMSFGQIIGVMVGVAVPIMIIKQLLGHFNKK